MKIKLELLTLGVIVLFIAAFAYVSSTQNHEWSGADGQAKDVISDLTGGTYIPWFQSIYQPPSGEIESLLFALQAAVGSLIIGYFLGYYRAMAKIKAGEAVQKGEGKSDA
ncbi:MAG: energy-coupling factor ABC transporter substrate-binding protein [Methanothrix sp.]|nr:energy-coupling factor ABC transporter substrate-binding protein [Methanothrix sp.]